MGGNFESIYVYSLAKIWKLNMQRVERAHLGSKDQHFDTIK